jgi:antitoxin component YwqK of YwqJK toxin-antitoxin module
MVVFMKKLFLILCLAAFAAAVYMDRREGLVMLYYENGNIMYEIPYRNGLKEGLEKRYSENGRLEHEVPYKNGKKDGVERFYSIGGALAGEISYIDGRKEGFEKWYFFSDGRIKRETLYKSGRREGVEKRYYEIGSALEILYKDDRAVSALCIGRFGDRTQLTDLEIAEFNEWGSAECR